MESYKMSVQAILGKLDIFDREISDHHGFIEVSIKGSDEIINEIMYGYFDNENKFKYPDDESVVLSTLKVLEDSCRKDIIDMLKDEQ